MAKRSRRPNAFPGFGFGGSPIKPPKPTDPAAEKPDKPILGPKPPAKTDPVGAVLWESTTGAKSGKYQTPAPESNKPAKPASASASSAGKPGGPPKPATNNKSNPPRHTASQPASSSSTSYSTGGGSSSGGSSSPVPEAAKAVAKSQKQPPKPGKWYQQQREQFQAEAQNRRPADAEGNAPQSAFDWSMSSGDVKKARDEWLSKHSALRKAIKNGTMTMGDANLAVRRMSAKSKAAAPPQE